MSGMEAGSKHRTGWIIVLSLLWLTFARLTDSAVQNSATVDEGFHITSGNEYLHTGRVHLLDEHTPLIKAWMALPLLPLDDLTPPPEAPGYAAGNLIQVAQATTLAYRPLDRVIVPPRLMIALLTVLLLAIVYRWAADGFGASGGLFALAWASCDPNLLAHGALATTDLGAAMFILGAGWAFARYLRRPTWGRWAWAGIMLGCAQLSKLTALLLLPLLGALMLWDGWQQARSRGLWRASGQYLSLVAVAALIVWAAYGFELRPVPAVGGAIPLPAASHIERLLRLRQNLAYGRESFLLGQNGMHGWMLYFPIAFVLKTPLGTLLLLALLPLLARRYHLPWREELALGLFPLLYFLSALSSTIDIGYRHLLPILPYLYVSAGRLAAWLRDERARWGRWLLAASFALTVAEGGWLHPHYLTYFNLIAGGADRGWQYLADSNTDWGQALKFLAARQRRDDLGPVYLSQFTFYDPAAYGVDYRPLAPLPDAPPVLPRRFDPQPGWYAISATTLDGVPLPYPPTYDWFRHREPQERLGHALFLYHVIPSAGQWLAQCQHPVVPLTGDAIAAGFGRDDLRRLTFDCEQTWVVPPAAGWYARAIPPEDRLRWPRRSERFAWLPAWTASLDRSALHLSYVQPQAGTLPPFAIWQRDDAPIHPPHPQTATLDGTLALLGYAASSNVRPGQTTEVLTFWRVLTPPARPLSLMLHLTASDGSVVAVGDGLGFPVDQWRTGDLIIQQHALALPDALPAGTYTILGGAYWLDDLSHLRSDGADAIALGLLTVP